MKKLFVSMLCMTMLLAGLAASALVGPAADAQGSTSHTGMWTPNWSTGNGTVPHPTVNQFNPALGQLLSATITTTATIETIFDRMSNESSRAGDMEARTLTKFCAALLAADCAGSDIGTSAASAHSIELEPAVIETFPNMEPQETRYGTAAATDSRTGTMTVTGADLQRLMGTGTAPVFCKASAFTGASGPGTAGADWRTLAGCSVSISYAYVGVDIEKTTNGYQADVEADSVKLTEGDAITWNYLVANTGTVALVNAQVTDNMLGAVCVIDRLEPGESTNCTMTGTAELGMHRMEATIVASAEGQPAVVVSDVDPTGYLGVAAPVVAPVAAVPAADDPASQFAVVPVPTADVDPTVDPQIDIELATNSVDADASSGPTVANGDPIEWTYVVTNTGATELVDVVVIDGAGNTICTIGLLGRAQSSMCSVPSQASCVQSGRRDATVSGVSPNGVRVGDADPTHWSTGGCANAATPASTSPVVNTSTPKTTSDPAPAGDESAARATGATRTDLPTSLAYTGSESNGLATLALVVSALGLAAFSGSEALKRRHGGRDDSASQG